MKERKIKQEMEKVLKDLGCDNRELSILFTDDREMSALNSQYRAKEGSTNVLAFAMDESGTTGDGCASPQSAMLGDVVISLDRAQQESVEFGETLEQRVNTLLVHGVLHLVGYDHEKNDEEAILMEKMEKRLAAIV